MNFILVCHSTIKAFFFQPCKLISIDLNKFIMLTVKVVISIKFLTEIDNLITTSEKDIHAIIDKLIIV
jgi:hypothetical protein